MKEAVEETVEDRVTKLSLNGHDISDLADNVLSNCAQPSAACNSAVSAMKGALGQFNTKEADLRAYFAANPAALTADLQQRIANESDRIDSITRKVEMAMSVGQSTGEMDEAVATIVEGPGSRQNSTSVALGSAVGAYGNEAGTSAGVGEAPGEITDRSNDICGSGGDESQCRQERNDRNRRR